MLSFRVVFPAPGVGVSVEGVGSFPLSCVVGFSAVCNFELTDCDNALIFKMGCEVGVGFGAGRVVGAENC